MWFNMTLIILLPLLTAAWLGSMCCCYSWSSTPRLLNAFTFFFIYLYDFFVCPWVLSSGHRWIQKTSTQTFYSFGHSKWRLISLNFQHCLFVSAIVTRASSIEPFTVVGDFRSFMTIVLVIWWQQLPSNLSFLPWSTPALMVSSSKLSGRVSLRLFLFGWTTIVHFSIRSSFYLTKRWLAFYTILFSSFTNWYLPECKSGSEMPSLPLALSTFLSNVDLDSSIPSRMSTSRPLMIGHQLITLWMSLCIVHRLIGYEHHIQQTNIQLRHFWFRPHESEKSRSLLW